MASLAILAALFFASLIAWRVWLVLIALAACARVPPPVPDEPAPVYTVMVALFREGDTLASLARALGELRWPADRLEILLLLETGDTQTAAAVGALTWPANTRTIHVPPGCPQTKPRALNYGLLQARGKYVCS